jgi:uroporphyrinogen decarboxylase
MNRRERVITTINHREPDFIPYNFHGVPAVWDRVFSHFGLRDEFEAIEFIGNHIVKIGSDFNFNPWDDTLSQLKFAPSGSIYTNLDLVGGHHKDEFGCIWERKGSIPHPVAYPMAESTDLNSYSFPDPYRQGRFDKARDLVDRYQGEVYLLGKLGMILFERAWSIRGMTQLLMDMIQQPAFVEDLLDRILYEWNLPIIEQQLALGVDGFYFGDDWATAKALMFSPELWRKFIKPRLSIIYKRCNDAGVTVWQHSDGNIDKIFPDLIEIGMDVFNPLSPSIMNPSEYKTKYGNQITFFGGIDVEKTLPFGTPEDVRQEIQMMVKVMGKGGGYILRSSHTILDDVPLMNLVAYINEVRTMAGLTVPSAVK